MIRIGDRTRSKGATLAGFALLVTFLLVSPLWSATTITLTWSPNTESDLAGYRLEYGTSSGVYIQTIDVGTVTTYSIPNLDSTQTYYFIVLAYDYAGNASPPSNEVSGSPKVVAGPAPTVASAVEVASDSIYIMQSGRHAIRVTGSNFQSGAVVNLGADITAGPTSLSGGELTLTLDVGATAMLGPRTLTVTNPDSGSGSKTSALTLARTADINRDCLVDAGDLNALARVFRMTNSNPAFNSAADLNGDGMIDGGDLAIFAAYFGLRLAVCP